MIVYLRRTSNKANSISIMGEEVEVMDYKYLSVHIDNSSDWKHSTNAIYMKGQSRLYFLKKLRSFSVCSKMLHIFHKFVVEC